MYGSPKEVRVVCPSVPRRANAVKGPQVVSSTSTSVQNHPSTSPAQSNRTNKLLVAAISMLSVMLPVMSPRLPFPLSLKIRIRTRKVERISHKSFQPLHHLLRIFPEAPPLLQAKPIIYTFTSSPPTHPYQLRTTPFQKPIPHRLSAT
jgi:hypothetical protein